MGTAIQSYVTVWPERPGRAPDLKVGGPIYGPSLTPTIARSSLAPAGLTHAADSERGDGRQFETARKGAKIARTSSAIAEWHVRRSLAIERTDAPVSSLGSGRPRASILPAPDRVITTCGDSALRF